MQIKFFADNTTLAILTYLTTLFQFAKDYLVCMGKDAQSLVWARLVFKLVNINQ